MADNDRASFWTSLPGVVTAIAALLTAVGGLLVTLNQIGVIGSSRDQRPESSEPTDTRTPETTRQLASGSDTRATDNSATRDRSNPPPSPVTGQFAVNGLTETTITVQSGQRVTVEATGTITVTQGYPALTVEPGGFIDELSGDRVSRYSIAEAIPHGALLCRVSGAVDDDWRLCGPSVSFVSPVGGTLEFHINDTELRDNDGAFAVNVDVR